MKTALLMAASAAALAGAQVTTNSTTGQFTCAKPNGAYCAGNSLGTDIIIRCDANGNGQPGRCSDVRPLFPLPSSSLRATTTTTPHVPR